MKNHMNPGCAEISSAAGRPEMPADGSTFTEDEPVRAPATSAEKERDEYRDLLQRTQAEFENYQKRVAQERSDERRYAHAPLVRDLLPVLDNLQRALDAAEHARARDPLVQGIAMVQSQLMEMLRRFGITVIEAQGRPLDPAVHEAVVTKPQADASPGTVIDILEPGYRIHERVLRPAKVSVAVAPSSKREPGDERPPA